MPSSRILKTFASQLCSAGIPLGFYDDDDSDGDGEDEDSLPSSVCACLTWSLIVAFVQPPSVAYAESQP